MPAIRNKKKVRATNVSIRLSDEQKRALNQMSLDSGKPVADIVTQAVMQVYGKELDGIIKEKNLQTDEHESSEMNVSEQVA